MGLQFGGPLQDGVSQGSCRVGTIVTDKVDDGDEIGACCRSPFKVKRRAHLPFSVYHRLD